MQPWQRTKAACENLIALHAGIAWSASFLLHGRNCIVPVQKKGCLTTKIILNKNVIFIPRTGSSRSQRSNDFDVYVRPFGDVRFSYWQIQLEILSIWPRIQSCNVACPEIKKVYNTHYSQARIQCNRLQWPPDTGLFVRIVVWCTNCAAGKRWSGTRPQTVTSQHLY